MGHWGVGGHGGMVAWGHGGMGTCGCGGVGACGDVGACGCGGAGTCGGMGACGCVGVRGHTHLPLLLIVLVTVAAPRGVKLLHLRQRLAKMCQVIFLVVQLVQTRLLMAMLQQSTQIIFLYIGEFTQIFFKLL